MPSPRLPSPYTGKKDYTIVVFILVSLALHLGAIYMGAYLTPPPPPPPIDSSLDIEIEGEKDEPPPLGTNDAETGPPPEPEPTPPPPIPEPEPEMTPPPPVPEDFVVPEETPTPAPTATPRPKATPKATPKPAATPSQTTKPTAAAKPAFNPNARPGAIKGVDAAHGGVAGGKGAVKSGGKADFTSTPSLIVPYQIKQRLQGVRASASATISYSGGSINDVSISKSSGNSSLDSLIVRHVRSNYRVKAGASGKANLPIGIRL